MHSLFIGRWQPLHDGHKAIIQRVLNEGKKVLVAIRDTKISENNPYSVDERKQMFKEHFGNKVDLMVIPDIAEVCYGRDVGYQIRRIKHNKEDVSATKIRENQNEYLENR